MHRVSRHPTAHVVYNRPYRGRVWRAFRASRHLREGLLRPRDRRLRTRRALEHPSTTYRTSPCPRISHQTPPPHLHPQAIGLLASLLAAYEAAAPPSHLTRASLAYTHAQCLAAHAPLLPAALRADIRAARTSGAALRRVEAALFAEDRALAARERTTQAADLIRGGVKSNALPERAGAVVNHRIAVDR